MFESPTKSNEKKKRQVAFAAIFLFVTGMIPYLMGGFVGVFFWCLPLIPLQFLNQRSNFFVFILLAIMCFFSLLISSVITGTHYDFKWN